MKVRNLLFLFSVFLVSLVVAVSCTSPSSQNSSAANSIQMGFSAWPGWFPWQVAQEAKLFDANKVSVDLKWFDGYLDSINALTAGQLDANTQTLNDTVSSVAAGGDVVIVLVNDNSTGNDQIIVREGINSVADLKGKKVAFQKASIGHYLILRALEKEGLKLTDVQSVYLPPPDASAAFSQGKVDAWFIWEPFVTRNEQKKIGRVLIDGSNGLRDTNNFFSTTRKFYQENPEVIKVFLDELQKAQVWSKEHPKEIAQLLAPVTQLDVPTLEKMHNKYDFSLVPITDKIITKQQDVADKWYSLKLIPKKVNVRDGFLSPEEYAKITPQEVLARQ